ncbi:MAG: GNAT family N-acetyltransferase [Salibacteraceae bacterium]
MEHRSLNQAVFEHYPELKTKRLTLREIQPEDARLIFDMRTNDRVNQFIARPVMDSVKDSDELVARTRQAYTDKQGIAFAGMLRENRDIIGSCGFNYIDHWNLHAEIGGELSPKYWGKHIALEAFSAILQFGFDTFGLHSIEARVNPDNRGAIYLMQLCGFQRDALYRERVYFKGEFLDMAVYNVLENEVKYHHESA